MMAKGESAFDSMDGFDSDAKVSFLMKKYDEDHDKLNFISAELFGGIYKLERKEGILPTMHQNIKSGFEALNKKLDPYIEQCNDCVSERQQVVDRKFKIKDALLVGTLLSMFGAIFGAWYNTNSVRSESKNEAKAIRMKSDSTLLAILTKLDTTKK
jgi:hypothetical protein